MLKRAVQLRRSLTPHSQPSRISSLKRTMVLSAALDHGILNLPGITPGSQAKLRELLEEDYKEHHCFYGRGSLHNHLSHHLYAAYDLGASASALKAMYADEAKMPLLQMQSKSRERTGLNILATRMPMLPMSNFSQQKLKPTGWLRHLIDSYLHRVRMQMEPRCSFVLLLEHSTQ